MDNGKQFDEPLSSRLGKKVAKALVVYAVMFKTRNDKDSCTIVRSKPAWDQVMMAGRLRSP